MSEADSPRALGAIDHVAVQVRDIGEAVLWYTGKFDCRVAYQDSTWALLQFSNIRLALVVPGQHPAHLGVVSEAAEDYGPLKLHRDGTRSAYIADPSGNTVEILAPYDSGAGRSKT